MPTRLQFDFTFSKPRLDSAASRRNLNAMRILLMGDFSGRNSRGLHEIGGKLTNRQIFPVDVENFTATMSRIAPQLNLAMGETSESSLTIDFAQLNDFHPDQLYSHLELFQDLRTLRVRLTDSRTFPQAKVELQRVAQPRRVEQPVGVSARNEHDFEEKETDDALLDRLLGKQHDGAPPSGSSQTKTQAIIRQLIKDIVAPHIVPEAEPFQAEYVAAIDEAISKKMQDVLHHPEFQALEALWRSIHALVTGLETDEQLRLYLLDITKDELREDIQLTEGPLEQSQLYKLLVEKGAGSLGGETWSILVGDYTFTTHVEDLSLLASLGAIASQAGGPFLAAANASLLGCHSVVNTPDPKAWRYEDQEAERNWMVLRQSSVAPWIGLAHPRVLLRLPYGKNSDAPDNFEFEELGVDHEHDAFLWGNPAFTCALLLALAYQDHGWSMTPGNILDVPNLPAFTFKEDGEMKLMPCAEVFLTERAAETMLDRGVMPLVSYRNRNAARLMRFQSIAEPLKALAGPWA